MRIVGRNGFRHRVARQMGFTLVELMIVVVILGILAALAIVGFRRYIGRARSSEAISMLAEMASKQQVYYGEFFAYLPLRADNNTVLPSPDEGAGAFYPTSPNAATFESSRTATSIANALVWPPAWRSVGLRPKDLYLYCTYLTNAGPGNAAVPAGLGFGVQMLGVLGAGSPPWFYSLAACNLTGPSGFPAAVSIFGLTSNSPTLRTFNDGM